MRPAILVLLLGCAPPAPVDDTSGSSTSEGAGTPTTSGDTGATSGSSGDASSGDASSGEAPLDGLRVNQLQAMGTHNSYHTSPGPTVPSLDYTHRPLAEQLDAGARQFELDIHFKKEPGEAIDVYHLEQIDMGTTCASLTECAAAMRGWSDANPRHHLLYVMIEVKTPYNAILVDDLLQALEDQILAAWPRERIVAPDDVRGDAVDLPTALAERGWPTIEQTRGKALFVLHDGEKWRDRYVARGVGGLLFADAFGDLTAPFAAVHTLNDAFGDAAKIAEVVDAGHIVRTRADADNVEPLAGDTSRAEAALASGATFISTDYPPPKGELNYVFEIPGGSPSRCNPRTAPADCTAAQIEAP